MIEWPNLGIMIQYHSVVQNGLEGTLRQSKITESKGRDTQIYLTKSKSAYHR